MSKVKIIGYTRVANSAEAHTGMNSVEQQKKAIQQYVANTYPEYELDIWEDVCSGTLSLSERDNYKQIRPFLLSGNCDVLVTKNVARLSRSIGNCLDELAQLRRAGVKVVFTDNNIAY